MIDISQFGKGAVETPVDISANHFRLAAATTPMIDWHKPRRPRYLPVMNQRATSSCVAHATTQYGRHLNYLKTGNIEEYSVRQIYSQGWLLPTGGMYIWKGLNIPLNQGFFSSQSVPPEDYLEATLRDPSLNVNGVIDALPLKYAVLNNNKDMDYLAQCIDLYGGLVTGFNGENNMFLIDGTTLPINHIDWAHSVYVYDYGINAAGDKCLIYLNSWSSGWADQGYGNFPETFVKSGLMFDLYTYASILDIDPTSMNNRLVTVNNGNGDVYMIKNGQRSLVANLQAFQLISGDWSKVEKISQAQMDAIPKSGQMLVGADQD